MYYGVRDADHDPVAKDGLVAKWQVGLWHGPYMA